MNSAGSIDAVVVANQRVGDAAELQQPMPVGIVPRQAGDLQAEDDAHVSQRDFAGEASEAGALVGAWSRTVRGLRR